MQNTYLAVESETIIFCGVGLARYNELTADLIVGLIFAAAQEWTREINMGFHDLTAAGAPLNETIMSGQPG